MPWSLSHSATCEIFLSCVRPDRISSPITSSAAVQVRSRLIQTPFGLSLSKPCPSCAPKEKSSPSTSSGRAVGFVPVRTYIHAMTQYITVAADDRLEAKNGIIKLHGPEGFAGMRKAGRLAAEILDALVAHVVPGVSTQELDDIVYKMTVAAGAIPATLGYRGY